MSRLRILVVSGEWFPDRKSGFARAVTGSARMLADRGHEVTVLAPRCDGAPIETSEGSLLLRRVLHRNLFPLTFTDVAQTRAHACAYRGRGIDVVLAHAPTTAVGAWAARLGVPLVLACYASVPREVRFSRSRLPLGRERLSGYALEWPLALLERAAVRRAERILVLSEFSRSILEEDHPKEASKTRRVLGGVDSSWFTPGDGMRAARSRLGIDPDKPLLLTVRRLEPRMGLELLLRAVEALRIQELTLAVVGKGSLEEKLRRLSVELAFTQRVRFVGGVSDSELRDWYRAADLFVLPTIAYEGFGMATIEALASGTPVVGTPVGATPELLGPLDARLVAHGTEATELAEAIGGALDRADVGYRRRCREYAVRRFEWRNVILDWERELIDVGQSRTFGRAPIGRSTGARATVEH